MRKKGEQLADYLSLQVAGQVRRLTLKDGKYPNTWEVVEEDGVPISTPSTGGLYINGIVLDRQPAPAGQVAETRNGFWEKTTNFFQGEPAQDVHYQLTADVHQFADLYTQWRNNDLRLTRGVTGTHPGWNDLVRGTLRSEGHNDLPTFTMGNAVPTSWLPASHFGPGYEQSAAMPAIQDLNNVATRTAYEQVGTWLPVGGIVRIHLGQSSSAAICWLNAGEILVRGPLNRDLGEFDLVRLLYARFIADAPSYLLVTPPPREDLLQGLTQRPFEPTAEQMENWIAEIGIWHATIQNQTNLDMTNPVGISIF